MRIERPCYPRPHACAPISPLNSDKSQPNRHPAPADRGGAHTPRTSQLLRVTPELGPTTMNRAGKRYQSPWLMLITRLDGPRSSIAPVRAASGVGRVSSEPTLHDIRAVMRDMVDGRLIFASHCCWQKQVPRRHSGDRAARRRPRGAGRTSCAEPPGLRTAAAPVSTSFRSSAPRSPRNSGHAKAASSSA